jgi:c-di-GMP-binding flagellar brake protein YcgR
MSQPGVDRPELQSVAAITLIGHDMSVSARVELVQGDVVVVRPSGAEFVEQVVVQPGDVVEVLWKTAGGQRALPAEVTEIEHDGVAVRWRMRATGPAEHSQRRTAVRGGVAIPVTAKYGGKELTGETVDLSEGGLRAHFDGHGTPPEGGERLDLVIRLEQGAVTTKAEVMRAQAHGSAWLLSIRFTTIEERDQDRIRRRVFQALREERVRLASRAEQTPLGLAEPPSSPNARG